MYFSRLLLFFLC